jgi:hypothetical protein
MANNNPRRTLGGTIHSTKTCMFCGQWPAALYRNINEKHSHRVCENCVKAGVCINENGVWISNPDYVTPPELPADPAEPQS